MSGYNWKQRLLIIPPLLLGALSLIIAPNMKAEPPKAADEGGKKIVRAIKVIPLNIQPKAIGYGLTQPTNEWIAQAEVEGRIIWISDQLKTGNLIHHDEVLLKLDSSSYKLNKAKVTAELKIAELKERTTRESLVVAQKSYTLEKEENARNEKLLKAGHVSQTERDKSVRDLLNSQQQVQNLTNELAISQAEQQVLLAELAMIERDIEHCTIKAPYDIRITEKDADLAAYINKGETLLKADGITSTEIPAQFPLGKMRPLRQHANLSSFDNQLHQGLTANIQLEAGNQIITWSAKVDRSGGFIDAQTQSQTIVVRVDNPYQQAIPGQRPPLIRDTFVKVTLQAPILNQRIVIPLNAIHNNRVYLAKDGKLVIHPVSIDFIQDEVAIIKSGLTAGDMLIVSQLQPAIEGMSIKTQPDKPLSDWIVKQAESRL